MVEAVVEDAAVKEEVFRRADATLPPEATIVKTIGDEVMVVGSDPALLSEWAVGFQTLVGDERPRPRIGMHYGRTLYRDGDYYGREVNLAARVAALGLTWARLRGWAEDDPVRRAAALQAAVHRLCQANGLVIERRGSEPAQCRRQRHGSYETVAALRPAASRSASALSVRSQVNSGSLRPK